MWWLTLYFWLMVSVGGSRISRDLRKFRREQERLRKICSVPDQEPSPRPSPSVAPLSALPSPAPRQPLRTQAEAQRDAAIGLLLHDEDDFRQALVIQAQRRARPVPPRPPFVPSTSNPPETTSTVRTSIFCLYVPPEGSP
jgi:hypothetical protein